MSYSWIYVAEENFEEHLMLSLLVSKNIAAMKSYQTKWHFVLMSLLPNDKTEHRMKIIQFAHFNKNILRFDNSINSLC